MEGGTQAEGDEEDIWAYDGEWRELHNVEFNVLLSSTTIF
jgi:hypothetical protein